MRNVVNFSKWIAVLILPVLLIYPNAWLVGTYANYIYIVFSLIIVLFNYPNGYAITRRVTKFWSELFFIVFFASVVSILLSSQENLFAHWSSILRYLVYWGISVILFRTTQSSLDFIFWVKSFLVVYSIGLFIVLLDGLQYPFVGDIFKVGVFDWEKIGTEHFRAYGAFLSPISAGVFLVNTLIMISVSLYHLDISAKSRLLLLVLCILTIVGLFMTASRTSLIGLLVHFCCLLRFSREKIRMLLVLSIAIVLVYYSGIVDDYILNITNRSIREAGISNNVLESSGRTSTLMNSFRLFGGVRTLMWGVGPGEYSLGDGVYSMAHNGFVSMLLCYGLLGSVLFVKILVYVYRKIICTRYLKMLFISYIFSNMVMFMSSDGSVTHFWLVNFLFFLYFVVAFSMYGSLKKGEKNYSSV